MEAETYAKSAFLLYPARPRLFLPYMPLFNEKGAAARTSFHFISSVPLHDAKSSSCTDTHSPDPALLAAIADVTLPAWDTPTSAKRRRSSLSKAAGYGMGGGGNGNGSGGGSAADSPEDDASVTPTWGGRHDGNSPALSAIASISPDLAYSGSPYHMESGGLYTPNGGRRGGRRGCGYSGESREEDMMDISSAARDLRELSQVTVGVDEKGGGAGGGRAFSSGRTRSGGLKAGRSKGVCVYLYICA